MKTNKLIYFLLITFIFLFLLIGCKAGRNVINHVSTDTVKNVEVMRTITRDSVIVITRDSVNIRTKKDTVFVDRFRTEYQRIIHHDTVHHSDTLYRSKVEIQHETKIVEVKKPLNWLEKTLYYTGAISLLLLILYIGWKIYNRN